MWSFVLVLISTLCWIAMLRSVIEQFATSAGSANFAVSVVRAQPGRKPVR